MENIEQVKTSRWKPLIEDLKYTLYLWKRTKLAMVGTFIVIGFLFMAIFAPILAPYDPIKVDLTNRLKPPSLKHPFGTDQFGRDILSRVIYGARIEVWIIFLVTVISGTIGLAVGITAGYFGGIVDEILMRITDIFLAFPRLILAMALAAMLGRGLTNAIIAISLVEWTVIARLARAEALRVKSQPYIEAIKALGAGNLRILLLHVLPMCLSPVLVQLTLRMGTIILTAAGLGFLGLGAQPPTPEWGAIVSDGRNYLVHQWWISTFPGLFIALVVLGFNLLGDGIRDILDPRLRR
ncbi:nickel transporter permease [Pseudothermotoga thermarum]|uniref:Binding-protein-dependent transport systems inner membrane component n=1 Tax=Pseudothermotoga thermarum DSM 5069 TaxID=688269 RepID=F7YYK5_9THEM|nr:nickel transporter permease [Pseudothermotoga thermarum]AEH51037.1 binding-protein-dependent transport systems inner membrane component [Pseudothermotoga thermarum DSM 5069]